GGFADFMESEDILRDVFRRGGEGRIRLRGQDALYRLPVEFLEALNGATKRITLPDGGTLDVIIPPGTRDKQVLRLRGKGGPGLGGGPPGDALVEIDVEPHRFFTRKDDDIHLELPISLPEAVLGAKLDVPTPTGPVRMTVPKGANTGTVLRLRGKGVARAGGKAGDEYVTLKVVLPERPDAELEEFARRWQAGQSQNPRQYLEAGHDFVRGICAARPCGTSVLARLDRGWLDRPAADRSGAHVLRRRSGARPAHSRFARGFWRQRRRRRRHPAFARPDARITPQHARTAQGDARR